MAATETLAMPTLSGPVIAGLMPVCLRRRAWQGRMQMVRGRRLPRARGPSAAAARPGFATGFRLAENVDDAARSADLELIRAIADGDEAAFGQLAEREAPRLLRFVRGLLGNAE